jgi:hypothetical protein
MRRVLLRAIFGKRTKSGKEPWQGGLLNMLLGLVRSVFGSSFILALVGVLMYTREIEHVTHTRGILTFLIILIGANFVGNTMGKVVHALKKQSGKVADIAEKQIVEAEQTQAVLKERDGLLSAAHAPTDLDTASLLRSARENEEEPDTLLRQAQQPE